MIFLAILLILLSAYTTTVLTNVAFSGTYLFNVLYDYTDTNISKVLNDKVYYRYKHVKSSQIHSRCRILLLVDAHANIYNITFLVYK